MKKLRSIAVTLIVFILMTVMTVCGIFTSLENKTYDQRIINCSPDNTSSDSIAFITVDQESINWAQKEMGWGWPWPRSAYGDIVRYLTSGNAQSILFDILYTEPSVYGNTDDEAFAQACSESGKVVQTMFVSGEDNESYTIFPIDSIKESACLIGNITSAKDKDDVIRRVRLSFEQNEIEYPTLGTAPYLISGESIDQLKSIVPIRKDGSVLIQYRKSIDDYIPYRASDILQSYYDCLNGEEPLIPPDNFENCTVYIAYYAPGLFDICSTPVSQVYPGVGVHITTYDNIINNLFIREVPLWITILYILLASLLGCSVIAFTTNLKSEAKKIIFVAILITISIMLIIILPIILFKHGLWMQIISPLFAFALSFLLELFISYTTEGKQKRFIKNAFSQYLSPKVIDQIIIDPKKLKLGGEKRCISIYFSDVQGFTSISEKLTPEKLTEVLNYYLSEMTDIILASGGTIDKYEGDALIAFWNAPADEIDHAKRCIEAAMKCQKRLEELRPMLEQLSSGGKLYQRIGMNTGYAVVGNMGSRSRFDYTMLGDSVNLAARLEGLNKQFGTYTMCTEATKLESEKFGTKLYWRELAKVAVVGKKDAVTVFEPMEQNIYEQKKDIITQFEKGRILFYSGEFVKALEIFQSVSDKDEPCRFYAEKCELLIKYPPETWDGVWHTDIK